MSGAASNLWVVGVADCRPQSLLHHVRTYDGQQNRVAQRVQRVSATSLSVCFCVQVKCVSLLSMTD